jgi:hypothetical protein
VSNFNQRDEQGLTPLEIKALNLSAELANTCHAIIYGDLVATYESEAQLAASDWNEIATRIHDIQARIAAQAAARAHPDLYRLLGRRLEL